MNNTNTPTNALQLRTKKNTQRLAFWTVAWVLSTALVVFGSKFIWDFQLTLTLLAVALNLALGVGMILATIQHVKGLDEMQQKITLQAAAFSLVAGLVAGGSYELWEDIKLITYQPEISHLIIFMVLAYVVGLVTATRKYQ